MSFKQFPTVDTPIQIIRRTIELPVTFESFTAGFENKLGHALHKPYKTLEELEQNVAIMCGTEPFSIYGVRDHGSRLALVGRSAKAKQYTIGDSRLALKMTSQDVRAALHAPIALLVYEVGNVAKIDYFTPQSLFGQFDNAQIDEVAGNIEKKEQDLIERVVADILASDQT